MLPADRRKLQPLMKVTFAPEVLSGRKQKLRSLQRIQEIRIKSADGREQGKTTWSMEVYTSDLDGRESFASQIPTNRLHHMSGTTRDSDVSLLSPSSNIKPPMVVLKQLDEFSQLRKSLYTVAHSSRQWTSCPICKMVMKHTMFGSVKASSLFQFMVKEEKTAEKLQKFMNDLLSVAITEHDPRKCREHWSTQILEIVYAFLYPHDV